jgi:two-component system chemotaxis response regulator CheB
MRRIRVLIVEDSPVVGEHLRRIISADVRLEVAGIATSGEEALAELDRLSPDVISMDIRLPGIQGFDATRRIMAERPTPIVVVSGIGMEEMALTMLALRAGALSAVEKPASTSHADYAALAEKLCTQLAIMSEVRVVRQRQTAGLRQAPETAYAPEKIERSGFKLLGIGASTGGPSALVQLLSGLAPNFPLPIVLVQHMAPAFLNGFAEWLGGVTPFPVSVPMGPTPLVGGHVYVAPCNDSHLIVRGGSALFEYSPPIGGHRPSANALFSSMARTLGAAGIGILLTGMGEDGALGLRDLNRAGSFTIAEHESTAVVYGMPGAAVQMGGVNESLPLGAIAGRVQELIAGQAEAPQ